MSRDIENLLEELKVMMSIRPHPNVLNLLGCCTTPGNAMYTSIMYPVHVHVKVKAANNLGKCRVPRLFAALTNPCLHGSLATMSARFAESF